MVYRVSSWHLDNSVNSMATIIGTYQSVDLNFQQFRLAADFSITSSTVLTAITGFSATVEAGRTYRFEVWVPGTCSPAASFRFAMAGTCTATSIVYEGLLNDANANAVAQTRSAALGGALFTGSAAASNPTAPEIKITGTITVNAGGTLIVQMCQDASNATASVALRGSIYQVIEMA